MNSPAGRRPGRARHGMRGTPSTMALAGADNDTMWKFPFFVSSASSHSSSPRICSHLRPATSISRQPVSNHSLMIEPSG